MYRCQRVVVVTLLGAMFLVASEARAQKAKPLTEPQVVALLGLGLDDETVTTRIKNGGVTFEASDELIDRLKAAGASDAVLKAIQDAGKSKPAAPAPGAKTSPPITYDQVIKLLELQLDEDAVLARIAKAPPIFVLSSAQEAELVKAGATPKVLAALKGDRPAAPQARDITDLAIILDCSGSMKETTPEGETKMAVAKRVVSNLIDKIPDGLNVTFIIYGHEIYGSATDARNCKAVKVVHPLAPLDSAGKAAIAKVIAGLKPTGATPIALSLRTAGAELKKSDSLCGLVLITDGLETCKGDPTAEAATLAADLKITFGVNVVGFGVKDTENAALKGIADAGHGKYYSADSAKELTESIGKIAQEIQEVAKKPETVDTSRRAVRVLKPKIEMPEMKSIWLMPDEEVGHAGVTKIGSVTKYGDFLNVPSSTKKYAIVWEPKDKEGIRVYMKRGFSIPDRRVVDVQPETILGMVQVNGTGKIKQIIVRPAGEHGAVVTRIQQAKSYGDIMVLPAGKYDIYVNDNLVEEGFEVQAGKLHRL